MTVSPQRAQDGNDRPYDDASGVGFGDRVETLPPTLFQLRNLKAATPAPDAKTNADALDAQRLDSGSDARGLGSGNACAHHDDQPRSPMPPAVHTGITTPATAAGLPPAAPQPIRTSLVTPVSEQSVREQSAPEQSVREQSVREQSAPEPHSNAPRDDRPTRASYPTDEPAGRSWMESIRSHGVMVVLLLVVIVAAVITSRNRSSEPDASFADSNNLLDIDEGLVVDLPLLSAPDDVSPTASMSRESETNTSVATLSPPTVTSSNGTEPTALAAGANRTVDLGNRPEASAFGSQQMASAQIQLDANSDDPSDPARRSSVNALPVSNRTSTGADKELSGPSVENLNGPVVESETVETTAGVATTTAGHQVSRTPFAVTKWLQHLDDYEHAHASEDNHSTPQ